MRIIPNGFDKRLLFYFFLDFGPIFYHSAATSASAGKYIMCQFNWNEFFSFFAFNPFLFECNNIHTCVYCKMKI